MTAIDVSDRYYTQATEIYRSLDDSKRLFVGLPRAKPTLEEALREAKVPDYDIVLKDSMEFANIARGDPEIAKLGLSDDEAGAIAAYTFQKEGDRSPYNIINKGLAGFRNSKGLSSTRKLIFLFLSGLRKLPRFRLSAGKELYRGMTIKVPTTKDEADGHQFYAKGEVVTWWSFTSTTTEFDVVNKFISNSERSTIFHISGEDLWGYDISVFSMYPDEKEILLEPEAKVMVDEIERKGAAGEHLVINVTLQKFENLVLEDVIPVVEAGSHPLPPSHTLGTVPQRLWRGCAWKECPDDVDEVRKYSVDEENPRIVTKVSGNGYCTVVGRAPLPLNTVVSWSIKVLKSRDTFGNYIHIGVAPSDIDQSRDDNYRYGWYLYCFQLKLRSGPPHDYSGWPGKDYGPKSERGKYVHTGDSVSVVMDTATGMLSFALNGVDLGVAYKGIPLDKPLVPCVLLGYEGDSVELVV